MNNSGLVIYDIDKVEKIVKYLTELPNDISEGEISLIAEFCKDEKIDVHVFYCLFNLEYELIDKTYKKEDYNGQISFIPRVRNPKPK